MTLDDLKVAYAEFEDRRIRVCNYVNMFPDWMRDAVSLLERQERCIESLKAEIHRLNEMLLAQARSDDHPRSQLIAVFEEVAEAMKKKTPKPLVGTCDGDLEP